MGRSIWAGRSEVHRDEGYDFEYKKKHVILILQELIDKGEMGGVVADIGAGPKSIIDELKGDFKSIKVDIAVIAQEDDVTVQMPMDVEKLHDSDWDTKKSLVKIRQWLNKHGIEAKDEPVVDTVIFSDVLNYLDYKSSLVGALNFLKPGGKIFIVNTPGHGYFNALAKRGDRSDGNFDVYQFLKEQGIIIESLTFNGVDFMKLTDPSCLI